MTKSNKSIIALHNGNTKVFTGRHGGDTSSSESIVRRHYNGIDRRIRQAAELRSVLNDMRDPQLLVIGDFNDRPMCTNRDQPLFGLSDVIADIETRQHGNRVTFDNDGTSVSLVVDASGRMLSAHCKSW